MPKKVKKGLSNKTLRQFLNELRDFVLAETNAQRQQIHTQWQKPLATRVAERYAIENVALKEIKKDNLIELTCTRNNSRFRAGDILCLSRNNPFDHEAIMVNLIEDDETTLIISSDDPAIVWDEKFMQQDGWTLDIGFIDLSNYIIGALTEAGDTLVGRERILPLLMNQLQPTLDPALYERGLDIGETLELNWDQCEALAFAYATDLVYLVQGPPGTGKTRVLATLVRALVSSGERVFVCSFTHRAINNALNAVYKQDPDIDMVKIGHPMQASDLLGDNYETFHSSPLADKSKGYVVGATPFATRTKRLAHVEFDTVIFDEASQITLPLAIMGMLAGQKYIFFGDQKQLPPVLTTRLTGGGLRNSIFGYLTGHNFEKMLTETYRLNDVLTDWPNQHFYDGLLTSVSTIAPRRIEYPLEPTRLVNILRPDQPKVFWNLAHSNNRAFSDKEAYAVIDLITVLLDCGFPAGEIGVVVPYRAQGRLIRNFLRQFILDPAVRRPIVVDTVERMQGQERELIILSLTTSNPGFAANIAEFFFQPERLNVAITRPRTKLIIIGSRHVLETQTTDPRLQETVSLLASLLDSCVNIRDFYDAIPEVYESKW